MKYDELMKQPNGILFYENDITAPALMQKVETVDDDIVFRAFDREFENLRIGLREMDATDRNSKDYLVFNKEQLDSLNGYFMAAYLATSDLK